MFRPNWKPRSEPLEPEAAVASGAGVQRLARRLLELWRVDRKRFESLSALADEDLFVVVGRKAALPWVDGLVYFGRTQAASALYLPTNLAPGVPPDLLERAVRRHVGRPAEEIFLVSARPERIVSLAHIGPIDPNSLRDMVRGGQR
ncbi:MAG: hypothetical protein ACLFVJ_09870 [Persicimonas sp.]